MMMYHHRDIAVGMNYIECNFNSKESSGIMKKIKNNQYR
jgi:hypothetical protein